MRSIVYSLFLISGILLSGCNDTARLDRLEADIRAIKSDTKAAVSEIKETVADANSGGGSALENRVNRLENRLTDALQNLGGGDERMAYLTPNAQGSNVIQTDHGPFLVRMEGIDLNVGGGSGYSGYTVHLDIGNIGGLAVDRFMLRGGFGSGAPVLPPGQAYSVHNPQVAEWLRTLNPFEIRVSKRLAPMSWTPIDIVIPANSRDDLELIRLEMIPESAEIEGITGSGGGSGGSEFAYINVESDSATVMKTDYGAFLIAVNRSEQRGTGTRLDIQIGNPYGFTVNQCRLVGDFGGQLPKRTVGVSIADFQSKLREWTNGLKPFSSVVDSSVSSLRWNKVSIIIPGSIDEVKTLRAQLRIENITLPQAVTSGSSMLKRR